jgi:hypothetical protein
MHEFIEVVSTVLLFLGWVFMYLYRRSQYEDRLLWESGWVASPGVNVRYTHKDLPFDYSYEDALKRQKAKHRPELAPHENYQLGQWSDELNYETNDLTNGRTL